MLGADDVIRRRRRADRRPSNDLTVAPLATGVDVQVGQTAIAIGSPFGLDQTVTAGIVSAVGRTVPDAGGAVPMLQTDAPINPGNSGGALADRNGRVIGINDSIASETRRQPAASASPSRSTPRSRWPSSSWRARRSSPASSAWRPRTRRRRTAAPGALIAKVDAGSPAAEAGLQGGDLITAVDGDAVDSSTDLVAAIRSRHPGDRVEVTFERDGASKTVEVTLGSA